MNPVCPERFKALIVEAFYFDVDTESIGRVEMRRTPSVEERHCDCERSYMAQPRSKAAVVKGILYPSNKDIKSVVASLQRKVKTDRAMAKQFKKDPRRTLASFGLNEDVQRELLQEMGMKTSARLAFCVCTDCCKTCWCTDCCITDINITRFME
jgi:hypothetical protein